MDKSAKVALTVGVMAFDALLAVGYFVYTGLRTKELAALALAADGGVVPENERADAHAEGSGAADGGALLSIKAHAHRSVGGDVASVGTLGVIDDALACSTAGANARKVHDSLPQIAEGKATVSGKLPRDVVARIVGLNRGRLLICYDAALRRNPDLAGRMSVVFTIDATGAAQDAADAGATLSDVEMRKCVVNAFNEMSFPAPQSGTVKVVYPLVFTPTGK